MVLLPKNSSHDAHNFRKNKNKSNTKKKRRRLNIQFMRAFKRMSTFLYLDTKIVSPIRASF